MIYLKKKAPKTTKERIVTDVEQAIKDIRTGAAMTNDDDIISKANALLESLERNTEARDNAETLNKQRKYSLKRTCFIKIFNAWCEDSLAVNTTGLSVYATTLLDYMVRRMNTDNFYGVNQKAIVQQTSLTYKRIKDSLKELEDFGLIAKVKNHSKNNPDIYVINSRYAHYFNVDTQKYFKTYEDEKGQPFTDFDVKCKGTDPNLSKSHTYLDDLKLNYNYNDCNRE